MRAATWRISLDQEDCQTAIENLLTARIGAVGGRLHAGRSRNDQVLAALRLYMRDAAQELRRGAIAVADALDALGTPACARWRCPATPTCSRPCRAASRSGRRALPRKSATMPKASTLTQRRIGKNPLGSAAGYGTPNLDISREETRRRLGFAVTQEPVTAVQLSRGKAEAQLLFEITLLAQDLGRLAADLLLFYTQEFGFVSLPDSLHHRLLHHAAKAQSRCLRADARAQRRRAGGAQRGARHHAKADLGLSPRFAVDQTAPVPRHRFLPADARRYCRARSTA